MKYHLVIAIFILSAVQSLANNYYGKKIGIENGLSQACVTCITYNDNGALWIGTRFGLNEYSNGRIQAFAGKSSGMEGSHINSLYCDDTNNLWIASDKGLFIQDHDSDSFRQISSDPAICIAEYRDTIFIGGHKGVLFYDKETETLKGKESETWTDLLNLYTYNDALICIDRRNGINFLRDGIETRCEIEELKGRTLMATFLDGDKLYLSILGEGILIYNLDTRTLDTSLYRSRKELSISLSINRIQDNIWIGTDGDGIFIFNDGDKSLHSFETFYSTNSGTEIPKSVTAIFQDPLGTIWLGGERFGLTGLKSSSIRTFLPDKVINYLYLSEDKQALFAGTNGDGVYACSPDYSETKRLKGTETMKITSIADFDKSRIILCAYNMGFFLYDLKTQTLKPFTIIDPETNARECLYGNSPEIYRLEDGRLLFFAVNNYLYEPKTGRFDRMQVNEEEYASDLRTCSTPPYSDLRTIYSHSKNGIFSIDIDSQSIRRVLAYNTEIGYINCIAYTDSSFVFGTDYGLYGFDPDDCKYEYISSPLFNRVTEACYGADGTLWIGADNRLFKYENNIFELVGENRGAAANELSNSIVGSDSKVYLAGSSGFMAIDSGTSPSYRDSMDRRIRLREVIIDGKADRRRNETITMPFKAQDLSISVSLSHSDPLENTVYRYTINGNSSYSFETLEEKNQIPIMTPGTYNIDVSYLKSEGKWSEPQTILTIKKSRPWYRSSYMLIIYFALAGAAVFYSYKKLKAKMLKDLKAGMDKKDISFINKFESYISEHLSDSELNVNQIASELAMSRATLYTKAKASFDKGIGEYIEQKRMEEAARLLKETSLSITEISERVGYTTSRYFSSRFKIYCGSSPLSYRKNNS